LNIIIRAIDYCPPVDITFGDYLRALITADIDLVPDDENSYRIAFIEAFREWGIYPNSVTTLSVESLKWQRPSGEACKLFNILKEGDFRKDIEHLANLKDREDIFNAGYELKREIHNKLFTLFTETSKNVRVVEQCLGLCLRPTLKLKWHDERIKFNVHSFQIHSIQPTFRIGLNFQTLPQFIINIVQKAEAKINGELVKFRGGCSLIFDLNDVSLKYAVVKRINSEDRLCRQLDYTFGIESNGAGDIYNLSQRGVFANIHSNT
jgi:hypothetical protein